MRISDWSSDVCSSDLLSEGTRPPSDHQSFILQHSSPLKINFGTRYPRLASIVALQRALRPQMGGEKPNRSARPATKAQSSPAHTTANMLCRRSEERHVGKEGVSTCRSR